MRIDRERLVELARREVEARLQTDHLVAAYLIGSVAGGEPVLGGAADIDIVMIHDESPSSRREVVPLSEDVHLDIAHHGRERYAQPRQLRVDPWLGPAVYAPIPLYDRDHLFEWAQAAARGQYLRPDHVVQRAAALLAAGRRHRADLATTTHWLTTYVAGVTAAANAVASLDSAPACGRRTLLLLEARLVQAGHPELAPEVLHLLGAEALPDQPVEQWLEAWSLAYDACARFSGDPVLSPHRRAYYRKGIQALLTSDSAPAALLPWLQTWDRVFSTLEAFDLQADHLDAWHSARAALQLASDDAARRADELETFLDRVEVILENWESEHGA